MAISAGISQKQTIGMVPEHILGKAVLKMSLQELQNFVQAELAENPALAMEEEVMCPACGSALVGCVCSTCGSRIVSETDREPSPKDESAADSWLAGESPDDSYYEPFARVAAPCSLADHLKEGIRTHMPACDVPAAEFIVDCLDEDGYLREPLLEIANRFGLSVPELEAVLRQVQSLDPPGVGARSLQECLLIQLRQLDTDCEDKRNAEVIVTEHWESISRMRLDETASRMGVSRKEVESALRFVREALEPRPASMFRDPWQTLVPRREAKLAPDVVIRETELGLVAEVVDPISSRVTVDEAYASLYSAMARRKNGFSEAGREQIRECVLSARSLIEALEFRRSALRKVAQEILRCQAGFLKKGPAHLKPMTKKQLAQQVGLHESTVCRATQGKTIRLPTGEVMPLDVLFDSALPVKELVKQFAGERLNGRPLSDGEIAQRLGAVGIHIARRTVAKYRDQLRVPPVDYRLA
jgi:RNA polymerase sigma-54 factor